MNPKISVIIPVYNTGEILVETINSVLEQTFKDFELIIVNDGSTDRDTLQILSDLSDERIKVIHKVNGGVVSARNLGLENAQGEYIAFLDHDDIFLPQKLEILNCLLDEHIEATLAFSPIIPFGEDISRTLKLKAHSNLKMNEFLRGNKIYSMSCVLVRKSFIDIFNIRLNKEFEPCDDWDFYLQLLAHGPFIYHETPLVKYRLHSGNQSTNLRKMYFAGINVLLHYRKKYSIFINPIKVISILCALRDHYYGFAYYNLRFGSKLEGIKYLLYSFICNPFSIRPFTWMFKVVKQKITKIFNNFL